MVYICTPNESNAVLEENIVLNRHPLDSPRLSRIAQKIRARLFASQCYNRILLRRDLGGNESCDKGQEHTDAYEDRRRCYGEASLKRGNTGKLLDDGIGGDADEYCCNNTDNSGDKADDKRLCVEHSRDISLARSDGTEDSDLLGSLEHADIGFRREAAGRV